jgi:integrase
MRLNQVNAGRLELPNGLNSNGRPYSEVIFFDDDLHGFGVRVRAGGRRTWVVQYRVGHKQRRTSIGKVGVISAERARADAKKKLAEAQLGRDPQAERAEANARAAVTFSAIAEKYLERARIKLRPRSFTEVERHLKQHWAPFQKRSISQITRAEVAVRLETIATDSGKIAANRARSTLAAFFRWAMQQGIADIDPVIGTEKFPEQTRERVLADSELARIWRACRSEGDYGRIVRLLMLTGLRRNEVAGISDEEIDPTERTLTIPGARTKNKREHVVPLSDAAFEILESVTRRHGRKFLFGSGAGPFSGWSRSKFSLDKLIRAILDSANIDAQRAAKGKGTRGEQFLSWHLHDLRRTLSTWMHESGIEPHIADAVLNHTPVSKSGVRGVYNRATYKTQKRQALDLWAAHVIEITAGRRSNVVVLPRA